MLKHTYKDELVCVSGPYMASMFAKFVMGALIKDRGRLTSYGAAFMGVERLNLSLVQAWFQNVCSVCSLNVLIAANSYGNLRPPGKTISSAYVSKATSVQ